MTALRAHVADRTRHVFQHADLYVFRLLLGTASILWAVIMAHSPQTFDRPAYALMHSYAPWWAWAALFMAHGVGAYWRIYAIQERERWAVVINLLGFYAWSLNAICLNVAIGELLPSTAMEIVISGFSGWALFRTGRGNEVAPA